MTAGPVRMRLLSGPLSMFGAKVQIAAAEKGLDFELVMVPFEMQRLYEPKHPDVLRINPKRQVPVLMHGDLEIFEFHADLRIFRGPATRSGAVAGCTGGKGASALARAQVRRGLLSACHSVDGPAGQGPRPRRRGCPRRRRALLSRDGPAAGGSWNISPAPTPTRTLRSTWRSCSATGWVHRSLTPWRACCGGVRRSWQGPPCAMLSDPWRPISSRRADRFPTSCRPSRRLAAPGRAECRS